MENPNISLVEEIALERFGLDEQTYRLFKFSESKSGFSVGVTDGEIPVSTTFPKDFVDLERIVRRHSKEKQKAYVKDRILSGRPIPLEIHDRLFNVIKEVEKDLDLLGNNLEEGEEVQVSGTNLTVKSEGKGKLKLKK